MKKTVLASAVLLAMAGAASATPDFGTITIDGKTADSSALATETNGSSKLKGHLKKKHSKLNRTSPSVARKFDSNESRQITRKLPVSRAIARP